MRRWNGWGEESTLYPVPQSAVQYLEALIGPGLPAADATLPEAVSRVPSSHLPHHPLVDISPEVRLRHARGQSSPDWIALRSGRVGVHPDGVAFPSTEGEIQALMVYARQNGASVIPYGGGTSVAGHINPLDSSRPVLTIAMGRMNRMLSLDAAGLLAAFEAGVSGPYLEAQLRAHGFTLGHYPQSFEFSTLGGWVATRSTGQQSLRYGRIEKLFAGGRLFSPSGLLELPLFPASAAGPDLREAVLGSEGRAGILTRASVRISPLPEREAFHGIFFPDFESGSLAARQIVQSGLPVAMLRLSTPQETSTTLAMAGHENLIALLEGVLSTRRIGEGKCLLLAGFAGSAAQVKFSRSETLEIARKLGGVHVGRAFGEQWHKNRFRTPYLRNSLWDLGYVVDTLETATRWAGAPAALSAITGALNTALADRDERVHVFTHLSHLYPYGTSIYTTFIFRMAPDPGETLARWLALKDAGSQAVVQAGGTISHQHGVGVDHLPYLAAEKGELGIRVIQNILRTFDPDSMMNPGKLVN